MADPPSPLDSLLASLSEEELLAELQKRRAASTQVSANSGSVAVGNNVINSTINVRSDAPPAELLRAYYRRLAGLCGRLPLDVFDASLLGKDGKGGAVSLDDVYVWLDVLNPKPRERDGEDNRRPLLEVVAEEKRLVLLGDAGSGKTTFINHVAGVLAQIQAEQCPPPEELPQELHDLWPVRIILRDIAGRMSGNGAGLFWNALREDMCDGGMDAQTAARAVYHLQELAAGGQVIFFLDGLDEVPETDGRRKRLLEAVQELAFSFSSEHNWLLISARPYAYTHLKLPGFIETPLAVLSKTQQDTFIVHWYRAMRTYNGMNEGTTLTRTALLQAAVRRPELMELAERPLLLTLMAVLHAVHDGELPEERAKLYNQSVDLLLGAWQKRRLVKDAEGHTRAEPGMMQVLEGNLDQVRKAMEKLAFQVHKRQHDSGAKADAVIDIDKGKVLDAFDDLLDQSEFRSRQLLDYLNQQAGLLIARADGGPYMFPHRSFQEFLAACYLARKPSYKELLELLNSDPLWWREVWLLAVGYLCSDREGLVAEIVHKLMPRAVEKCQTPTDIHWRKAILAGEALWEQKVPAKRHEEDAYLEEWEKSRDWLAALVQGGELEPRERAEAGDILARLGDDPRPGVGLDADGLPDIEWVDIKGGKFLMGEGKERHSVAVTRFRIARYPVTNAQYAAFIKAGGYEAENYWTKVGWAWRTGAWDKWKDVAQYAFFLEHRSPATRNLPYNWEEERIFINRPVRFVTWFEAMAFCRWLATQRNLDIRLPTEAQWEYAAAGVEGRKYPWGKAKWSEQRANVEESGLGRPTPVGMYPAGVTPEGVHDMIGNVWEWCLSLNKSYPYWDDDGRNDEEALDLRILRGSAYYISKNDARARYAFRGGNNPVNGGSDIGFRVVAFPGDF